MTNHCNGQTIFSFTHIEDITLNASEEVEEVLEKQVAWVWIGQVRLETGLVK